MFLLFYAATNGLGALTEFVPKRGKPEDRHCLKYRFFFAKWFRVCFLLVQHDTVDKNIAWNLRSRI